MAHAHSSQRSHCPIATRNVACAFEHSSNNSRSLKKTLPTTPPTHVEHQRGAAIDAAFAAKRHESHSGVASLTRSPFDKSQVSRVMYASPWFHPMWQSG